MSIRQTCPLSNSPQANLAPISSSEMRSVLLLLLSLSTVAWAYETNKYLPSVVRNIIPNLQFNSDYNSHLARSKRDIRVHRLQDPEHCLRNCSHRMNEGLQTMNETDSEEAASAQLCNALGPVETCYKQCPNSQLRTLLLDFLPTMKVPCLMGNDKYAELKKILDCLNSTEQELSAKCNPICNSSAANDLRVESRILLNMNPPFIMYDDDKKENTQTLRATCKYLTCQQQCGDPINKAKCGQMAVDLDRKVTASVFGSVIKLYLDMAALESDLDECKSVM